MAAASASIMGAPPPTIQRQEIDQSQGHHSAPHHSAPPAAPSSTPTTSGPIQSPKLPVERCMDMNNPRRAGNRCANNPNAGGCHIAVPAEAIASAARISP